MDFQNNPAVVLAAAIVTVVDIAQSEGIPYDEAIDIMFPVVENTIAPMVLLLLDSEPTTAYAWAEGVLAVWLLPQRSLAVN